MEILEGRGSPHGGVWVSLKHLPDNLIDYFFDWYGEWHGKGKLKYECFDIQELFPKIAHDGIEAKPAAHFWDGGIRIDENAETCVPGLFAAGEATGGNHGANRLSGNAMTETLVWGTRSGVSAANFAKKTTKPASPLEGEKETYGKIQRFLDSGNNNEDHIIEIKKNIQDLAWECIGPVRIGKDLERLLGLINQMEKEIPEYRCSNKNRLFNREWVDAIGLKTITTILKITAISAIAREESRGNHYRKEFPEQKTDWTKNLVVRKGASGEPVLSESSVVVTTMRPGGNDFGKQ